MSDIITLLSLTIRWLNLVVGTTLLLFGIIGNLLNIFIFTRARFRQTFSVRYLIAASMMSLIQLLQTLLPRILTEGLGISIVKSNDSYCKARNYIAAVATLCSLSFPCWATFNQFIGTCREAATRNYCTSKRFVHLAILFTILFWLLVQIPNLIFGKANGEACTTTSNINTYISSYVITPFTYTILPIISISYFNMGIIRNLRRARVAGLHQRNTRLARQVRRMLIPQLIILILSGIPFSSQTIYSTATMLMKKTALRLATESVIFTIVRLLFYLNYVCSFYIYVIMSSEIRRELKNYIWQRNPISPQETTA